MDTCINRDGLIKLKIENFKIAFLCVLCVLCGSAFGLVADLNDDNTVNQYDLAIFIEQWLEVPGTPSADFDNSNFVDFKDFAILAGEWTGMPIPPPVNVAPSANDVSVSAAAYIPQAITLDGSDSDSYPNPPGRIKYIITDLPADVNAYLQDPTSGGQIRIRPSDLPYKLSTWGSSVIFATSTTAGNCNFAYKVYDGNLYSNEKTVSINVAANPKDCLSFDANNSYVTIPDNSLIDLESNRAIGLCFNTRKAFCGLLKKHETGKAGYEVNLISGRITVDIYSATAGKVATIKSFYRYDNGGWANCVFAYNDLNDCLELFINYGDLIPNYTWYELSEIYTFGEGAVAVPADSYVNDCNLIIGKSNAANYRGEIDGIRAYNLTMTDVFRTLVSAQSRETAGNTESYVPTPIVRFTCNYDGTNNTATQIYDDKASHLIGTFNSSDHIKYLPFVWQWYDSAAFQAGGK